MNLHNGSFFVASSPIVVPATGPGIEVSPNHSFRASSSKIFRFTNPLQHKIRWISGTNRGKHTLSRGDQISEGDLKFVFILNQQRTFGAPQSDEIRLCSVPVRRLANQIPGIRLEICIRSLKAFCQCWWHHETRLRVNYCYFDSEKGPWFLYAISLLPSAHIYYRNIAAWVLRQTFTSPWWLS